MDIRCTSCCRKLAEAESFTLLSIKCPRCGLINHLSAESIKPPKRPQASPSEFIGHDRVHQTNL
ncbi:MAG: Com family DNA-binding transcriptional regulator [Pseudomonadota bacterium]|nr:Com family DNA-binding transcriptional regulator [Pseudomonadota bacterium]